MVRFFIFAALISSTAIVQGARADGLIFQLPADGTFAEFSGVAESEKKSVSKLRGDIPSSKIEVEESVTVSSVGELLRAEQKCRWIELKRQVRFTAEDRQNEAILKVLVAEQFLTRGEDPLDHAIFTFFNPKEVDKNGIRDPIGFNRIQYEIDRFRPVFPARLEKPQTQPKQTIKTQAGTFSDCEVVAGGTAFDRPLLGDGRWEFTNEWEIATHPDAPFGVVQLRCRSEGREINNTLTSHFKKTMTLTLNRIGTGAKSELPSKVGN